MSYTVRFARQAERCLLRLPKVDRKRILTQVDRLSREPRPTGARALEGSRLWRIRVGSYRVLYAIREAELVVVVVRVAQRAHAHDRLPGDDLD